MNARFTGLRHTLHPEESDLFKRCLSGVTGCGVEIGSLDGYSARIIAEASLLDPLVAIDPFVPDSMDAATQGNEENFRNNVASFGDRIQLIVGYSHDVVKNWRKKVDFLFIDGDHTRDAVHVDYVQWTPFLKSGGLLAMHDSRMNRGSIPYWPGPSDVASKYVYGQPEAWELIGEAVTLTIARKK